MSSKKKLSSKRKLTSKRTTKKRLSKSSKKKSRKNKINRGLMIFAPPGTGKTYYIEKPFMNDPNFDWKKMYTMKINDEKFLDGDKIIFTKKYGKKAGKYLKDKFISDNFRGDYKYNILQLIFNPFLKKKYNIVFVGNPLIEIVDILIVPNKKIRLKNLDKREYYKQSISDT